MRNELAKFDKQTIVVRGRYKSYAVTSGRRNNLFTHIMLDDVELTGHVWMRLPKEVEKSLKKKKLYEFTANVTKYYKGKDVEKEKTMDYCLINCRNFVEIDEEEKNDEEKIDE